MARGRTGIEHLLRRAGFGASPADLASFDGMSMSGVVDYLLNFEDQPDDTDTHIGNPVVRVGLQPRRRIPAQLEHRGCASALAVPHGAHAAAAAGEDGALLAQPLRHAYSKIAGTFGAVQGTKLMANVSGQLPGRKVSSKHSASWRLAASLSC
jgi:hypothetical protein